MRLGFDGQMGLVVEDDAGKPLGRVDNFTVTEARYDSDFGSLATLTVVMVASGDVNRHSGEVFDATASSPSPQPAVPKKRVKKVGPSVLDRMPRPSEVVPLPGLVPVANEELPERMG